MASELSTYVANALLAWLKGTTMPAAPAGLYVALYSSDPGQAGTSGTDVTNTVRTAGRVAVTLGTVAARAVANSADVDFGAAAGGATVTHFGVWDAASGGNFIGGSPVDTTRTIVAADPVKFLTGDLSFSMA